MGLNWLFAKLLKPSTHFITCQTHIWYYYWDKLPIGGKWLKVLSQHVLLNPKLWLLYLYRYRSLEQNDSKDRISMVIFKKPKRNAIHILYRHSVLIIYSCMYSTAKKQFFVDDYKKCSVILFHWPVAVLTVTLKKQLSMD